MANGTYAHSQQEIQRARWASAANVIAGLWLIAAPFVLDFAGVQAAQWNHIIVGAAVALMALVRATDPDHRPALSWANGGLGLWMIAAPWVLNYTNVESAQMNSIIMGIVIIVLGVFSAYETNQAHRHAGQTGDTR